MFWNSKSLYNPAASGIENNIYAAVDGRAQWIGIEKNPWFGSAVIDYKSEILHSGVGLNFIYEKYGYTKTKIINANYNYQFNLDTNNILSIGVSAGFGKKITALSELINYIDADPLINKYAEQAIRNYKIGFFYVNGSFEFGLNSNFIKAYELRNLFFLYSSYHFSVCRNFKVSPTILFDVNEIDISCGLLMSYKDKFLTGLSYKSYSDLYGAMLGYNIKGKIRIEYSIDFYNSLFLKKFLNHEFSIALMLK
jgi:type IX secretion system PorP/SprF family membrane protein